MSGQTRHHVEIAIPEIHISGADLSSLSAEISLKNESVKCKFPISDPVALEVNNLTESDKLNIRVLENRSEVGTLEMEIREQFPTNLQGDFDKWFKLYLLSLPGLAAYISPEKERGDQSSKSFTRLYENDTSGESAQRIGRIRLTMSINEVVVTKSLLTGENKASGWDRIMAIREVAPCGLDECQRCGYLEKLTVTQQNDLLNNDELNSAYQDLRRMMREQEEEELKLPAHFRMEYDHRRDEYRSSVDSKLEDCVAVDLPTNLKYGSGGLNAQEAEHLRMVILGLNEKLKSMQMLQHENKNLKQEIDNDKRARMELQVSIEETTEQLHKQHEKQCSINDTIARERANAVEALHQQHIGYKDKCDAEERLLAANKGLEAELAKRKAEECNFADLKAQIDAACKALNESENKRKQLQEQFRKSIDEFAQQSADQQELSNIHVEQIKKLQSENAALNDELNGANNTIDRINVENSQQKAMIARLESEVDIITDKESQLVEIMGLAKDHEIGRSTLQSSLNAAVEDFASKLKEIENLNDLMQSDKSTLNDTLNEVENNLELKNEQILDLQKENHELSGSLASLEQVMYVRSDVQAMIDDVVKQNEMYRDIKEQLMKELDFLTDYLLTQAEKTLSGTRLITKLKHTIDDSKVEIATLRKFASGAATKAGAYNPYSGDPVDEALAEAINAREAPLEIGFARQSPGSYIFGTKEIILKLEANRLLVQLGKGTMSLDEFIMTYTPLEQEKWEKQKNENSMRHRSVLGRLAVSISTNVKGASKEAAMSPDRASRLIHNAFGVGRKSSPSPSPKAK